MRAVACLSFILEQRAPERRQEGVDFQLVSQRALRYVGTAVHLPHMRALGGHFAHNESNLPTLLPNSVHIRTNALL